MIDQTFIDGFEGFELVGYVPKGRDGLPLGRSGVTIADGVDLGSSHFGDYLDRGLAGDDELLALLRPYYGLTGAAAVERLAALPLRLTALEGAEVKRVANLQHTRAIERAYDLSAGQGSWAALRDAAQTAIGSLAYQYGPDLLHRTPRFWARAVLADWPGAIAELRAFGDLYPRRRNAEADLLATMTDG